MASNPLVPSPDPAIQAAWAAVWAAQGLVLSRPRATMPAPRMATIHHTPWAALVNAVPPRATAVCATLMRKA